MPTVEQTKQMVEKKKIVTVFDFMEQKKDLIERALPKTITPDRLIGIFNMILRGAPQLSQCTQMSLISAVIQTVQLGLQPGNIGHVYLVPFNNKKKDGSYQREVQLIVGYRGLCELVNRSGRATVLSAEVVKQNDFFEYEMGLEPKLRHVPADGDRGEPIGVYAIAKNLLAGEKVFVYLQQEQIDKVKASSKAGKSSFSQWTTWPDEMAKKTAVKRLVKLLPLSSEIQKQIGADETVKNTISADIAQEKDETVWEGETVETEAKVEPEGNSGDSRGIEDVSVKDADEDPRNDEKTEWEKEDEQTR